MWQIFIDLAFEFDIMLFPFIKKFLSDKRSNAANLSFRAIVFYFIFYVF